MTFQSQVFIKPAPGILGGIASMNPLATVDAGPGGLTAGALGVRIGRFAWNTYASAGGPGVANNFCSGASRKPDGFLSNQQQGFSTKFLTDSNDQIPAGYGVTEHRRGDFWALSTLAEAAIGNKVFANLVDGSVLAAAAGATPTNNAGSACVINGTIASISGASAYSLNITTVTSGVVAVGQLVVGANIAPNTFIEALGTSTGNTGTVFLSQPALATFTTQVLTTAPTTAYGAFVGTATFATNVMTVATVTSGILAPGQIITSASVTAGTYIVAQLTGTPGGVGTYSLSTTPGTITPAQAATATSWIETDWYVQSAGNVMDLITVGLV